MDDNHSLLTPSLTVTDAAACTVPDAQLTGSAGGKPPHSGKIPAHRARYGVASAGPDGTFAPLGQAEYLHAHPQVGERSLTRNLQTPAARWMAPYAPCPTTLTTGMIRTVHHEGAAANAMSPPGLT